MIWMKFGFYFFMLNEIVLKWEMEYIVFIEYNKYINLKFFVWIKVVEWKVSVYVVGYVFF